jgi:hypothetical protein
MEFSERARPARALSGRDRAIIDFERMWSSGTGSKEEAIREQLRISPTLYYREMNALLETDAARVYDPLTVKRLQRQRDQRRRIRIEGRQADPRSR